MSIRVHTILLYFAVKSSIVLFQCLCSTGHVHPLASKALNWIELNTMGWTAKSESLCRMLDSLKLTVQNVNRAQRRPGSVHSLRMPGFLTLDISLKGPNLRAISFIHLSRTDSPYRKKHSYSQQCAQSIRHGCVWNYFDRAFVVFDALSP